MNAYRRLFNTKYSWRIQWPWWGCAPAPDSLHVSQGKFPVGLRVLGSERWDVARLLPASELPASRESPEPTQPCDNPAQTLILVFKILVEGENKSQGDPRCPGELAGDSPRQTGPKWVARSRPGVFCWRERGLRGGGSPDRAGRADPGVQAAGRERSSSSQPKECTGVFHTDLSTHHLPPFLPVSVKENVVLE